MQIFHRQTGPKSVMYTVTYNDGRTAYLWIDGTTKAADDHLVGLIAKEQQGQGLIPGGTIARIKRVR